MARDRRPLSDGGFLFRVRLLDHFWPTEITTGITCHTVAPVVQMRAPRYPYVNRSRHGAETTRPPYALWWSAPSGSGRARSSMSSRSLRGSFYRGGIRKNIVPAEVHTERWSQYSRTLPGRRVVSPGQSKRPIAARMATDQPARYSRTAVSAARFIWRARMSPT